MGLLGKAAVKSEPDSGIHAVIESYHQDNALFHCIVLEGGKQEKSRDTGLCQTVAAMLAHQQAVCRELSGGNCLALIPGDLDRELIAHRLSKSTNAAVLFQFSANAVEPSFEALQPYNE